ncbi:hypothetical protein RDV84_08865 [Lysobacter yananisis]|uniref:Tetratricopeptide repeat protein n=1 Tax=Lysobacter yananisis TaxID=1003114 RepID=A0ABY9PDG1_9GAMM|nr:hypothetical protein [Lysobacter yananisis]WMT04936.1 hypothetical protein RDV84_08865 [Lysobacter yananisis]
MDMNAQPDDLESRVLDLANQAIAHQAAGEHRQAAKHWGRAIALADSGLADSGLGSDDIRHWLSAGAAETLYRLGDYAACIVAARAAQEWSRQQHAPLAALLLGQAQLRLGRREAALQALREARALGGEAVWDAIDLDLRAAAARLLRSDAA